MTCQCANKVKYYCYVSGQYFKLNAWFAYEEKCIRFHCFCQADGRHNCPEDRKERACDDSTTRTPEPRTARATTIRRSQPHSPRQSEIEGRVCVVQGRRYRVGSRFQIRQGCRILQCSCSANAEHECPPDLVVDRCPRSTSPTPAATTTTSVPSITTRRAQPGRDRPVTTKRIELNFNKLQFMSGLESQPVREHQTGTHGLTEDNSLDLTVGSAGAEGRPMLVGQHPVNTTVKPGKQVRLYCRISTQGHPRLHWLKRLDGDISRDRDRRIVRVKDETFQVILADNAEVSGDDSSVYESYLTLEKVTYADSGMYLCMASNSRGYSYRSAFVTVGTRPENRLQADALASSSVMRSTSTPSPETTEGVVRYCRVGGRQFMVNAGFMYEKDCTRYHCACYNNATWSCPETENICDHKTSRPAALKIKQDLSTAITSPTPTVKENDRKGISSAVSSKECASCILDGIIHRPNSVFNINDGCMLFVCDCLCDGTWICPKDRTKNSCQTEAVVTQAKTEGKSEGRTEGKTEIITDVKTDDKGNEDVTAKCNTCRFRRSVYPGGEPFVFDEDCLQYQCMCNCDGTWECADDKAKDICDESEQAEEDDDGTWSGCQTCTAHGNQYKAYAQFEHQRDCVKMTCHCLCDGTVYCPPDEEQQVC